MGGEWVDEESKHTKIRFTFLTNINQLPSNNPGSDCIATISFKSSTEIEELLITKM